ncbi:MAG: phytanoyl-CoA dioxygenase family protein [Alcanivorax sp.]|uniref:phytanoyl-CoA dioxygenase family protein n=1 Tax=Alcanivorax sp. TaxID=1872427 RepID=UPI003DA71945
MIDLQQAAESLRRDGLVVFPGLYLDMSETLLREHKQCFSGSLTGIKLAPPMDGEKILPAREVDLLENNLTTLHRSLFPDWFSQLGARYFHSQESRNDFASICYDTFKHDRLGPGNHHPHWDPTLSLRLMVYVSDVTEKNGAIEVKPGTHFSNHAARLNQWENSIPYADPCSCSGADEPYQSIQGGTGTVIVFDVSLTHRKGIVAQGEDRRVAFSHIHSPLAQHQLAGTPFHAIPQSLLWPHGNADDYR